MESISITCDHIFLFLPYSPVFWPMGLKADFQCFGSYEITKSGLDVRIKRIYVSCNMEIQRVEQRDLRNEYTVSDVRL